MKYIKIRFTHGLDIDAYQQVENGIVTNYLNENGEAILLPAVTESEVIDTDPPKLDWMV